MSYANFLRRRFNGPIGALAREVLDRPVDLARYEPPRAVTPRAWVRPARSTPLVPDAGPRRKFTPNEHKRTQNQVLQYPRGFVEDNASGYDDKFPTRNRYAAEIRRGKELGNDF